MSLVDDYANLEGSLYPVEARCIGMRADELDARGGTFNCRLRLRVGDGSLPVR